MNLQTHITDDLWLAVQGTYAAGNYCDAILDALHHLSDVLRDKTGVDGDGAALVGQALGGDSPRLRINRLQTETEKNEQRGMESLLRGIYQAIRNPRSHEQIEDSQATADAIIHFINYLLTIIRRAEEPFVLDAFISRVMDPDFVNSSRYAELLVQVVPTNKRFDTLVEIYRRKLDGDIYNVGLVVSALLNRLTDDQVRQYLAIVSDELSTVRQETEFRYNLHMLPPIYWQQLLEAPRLRAENRVIRSIKEGSLVNGKCARGALATWARELLVHFTLKGDVGRELLEKLEDSTRSEQHYVVERFFGQLPVVVESDWDLHRCVKAISNCIREGDEFIREAVIKHVSSLPESWQKQFQNELKDLTDPDHPATYLTYDWSPFLTSEEPYPDNDDLPF